MDGGPLDDTLRGVGVRAEWSGLPAGVRQDIEQLLGADVVEAESQQGGFSPGVAARVRLRDGRRVFVKASSSEMSPDSPEINRREAMIASALPTTVPTPRLLTTYDRGGWVALVFEDVCARSPQLPWRQPELDRVIAAVTELATSLTPSPIVLPPISGESEGFAGFQDLRALAADGDELDGLDPWIVRNLDRLADLHDGWAEATRGGTLLHLDLRADNLLLTDERVMFIDWPWAAVGAAWIDLLGMLPSVAMQGGPSPSEVFDTNPLARQAEPEAVTVTLAGLTGMFVSQSRLPDPLGLPTLRRFQRAQGLQAARWLQQRTGWR